MMASFQIGIETNLLSNDIWCFITKKVGFIANLKRIINESFLFPKRIVQFQKGKLDAFSKTERFRILISVGLLL